MARQAKLGGVRGVREWQNLASAGDVRRYFRWLILSMRDHTLDAKDAAVMGQLGSYLLKALEVADLEGERPTLTQYLAARQNGHPPEQEERLPEQLQ
jgi:hypothetical protein